jgi:DNA repair protein RadD
MCTKFFDYGQPSERVEATIKLINRMKGFFWQRILYSLNVEDLIRDGYLCQLEYINKSVVQQSDIKLNVSRSDFDMEDLEYKMSTKKDEVAQIITWAEQTSKSVLVFCPSVKKATTLSEATLDSAVVSAKTPKKIRERIIKDFKEHRIKTVFNVGVLTTGFDHPALDCIILMRPTRSIALYYQMLGRGLRICEGKTTCKIIDLTGTVKEMGRVETIKLVKRNLWELESETGSWHDSELFVHYTKDGGKEFDNHNTLENALLSVKYPKAAPIVAAEEDDDEIIVEGIPFN